MIRSAIARALILVIVALLLSAPPVLADDGERAEKLFREGRRLTKQGRHREACEAFEGSNRAAPSVGALLNLGVCREKLGERARAWTAFRAAGRLAAGEGDRKRKRFADGRAGDLEGLIARVRIELPDDLAELEGLAVTVDGEPVDVGDESIALEPGEHRFAATLDGARWSRDVELAAGGEPVPITVELELGEAKTEEPPPAAVTKPAPEPDDPGRGRRWLGLGLVAGGVALAATGAGFGLSARSLWNEVEGCRDAPPCTDDEIATGESAASRANISTGLFVAAVAVAGAGAVVWLTAPEPGDRVVAVTPVVGNSFAGAAIGGRF